MQIIKLIKIFLILVCVGIYGYSAVNINRQQNYNISIDISMPLSIVWPFEVAVVGDNGEKGLRIAPKIGRGWRGEAAGEASYKFYVPKDGRYHIWAYCLWFDACTNAVFARIDDLDRAIVGNDPVFGRWHWVRCFDVHLEKGTHTFVLSNHSDHISLQKILLTNSDLITPEDCSLVFSDIFYDGFDGCDQGNFSSWEIAGGEWIVQPPPQEASFIENALIGKSEETSFIIYKAPDWSDYLLNMAVKSVTSETADASVAICFGVKDTTHYHQLKWRHIRGSDIAEMQISRETGEVTKVLADFEVPWQADTWRQVQIALKPDNIEVALDNTEPIKIPVNYSLTGGIGLRLEGRMTAYFDDVHVRQISNRLIHE